MKPNPEFHHRRSIRLRGYDYSRNGVYFVTLCTQNRECLFGEIGKGKGSSSEMVLNEYGEIVRDEWLKSAAIRLEIELDEFVVMPNHFHGIVSIHGRGDRPVAPTEKRPGPTPKSIGSLIAGFKSGVTKRINGIRQTPGFAVWQRNYYEHIVRDDDESNRIREYMIGNPANWDHDEYSPARKDPL